MKFLFGTVLCLVLVVISIFVSLQDYQSRMDEYDSAIAEFNENPDIFSVRIHRKPEVLSIFARGFERRFGNMVKTGTMPIRASGFMGTSESAQFSSEFASIDFLFVVRIVLSLLAIFISYDAISGEYERGTLKLTLSRPVPRSSIILGKLMAGAVCLFIPLVMSFIVSILIVQLIGGVDFTGEDWGRISLIFGTTTLCVLSFYMMGMVVSSRTRQAATSLLILLIVWLISVFLIPGIVTAGMDRYRIMAANPAEDILAMRVDFDQRRYSKPRPNFRNDREAYARWRVKWDELGDEVNHSIWSLQRQYLNKLYFQADLVRWICRLSPSESCTYAAEAMARTDVAAYRNFMSFARSYSEKHREFAKNQWSNKDKFRAEREKYQKAVHVPSITFSASFRAAAPDICLLVILNCLLFMLSMLFFIRYDVH